MKTPRNFELELNDKQIEAWEYLTDNVTVETLFGGGAGGGKTRLLATWISSMALKYPQTRYLIGRKSLEDIKKSTLLTLFDVLSGVFGMSDDIDYRHNSQDKFIEFAQSGSRIYYTDLDLYPSDPNYDYLGSTEYTAAAIDEAPQVTQKAKNVILSRLRYKLDEYNLIPKLGMSCNPDKGWLFTEFYKPSRDGTLPSHKRFVPALAHDNLFLPQSYIDTLERLDPASKARLLLGDWDYDDDPSKLCEFDALQDLFTNTLPESPDHYITADIARFGADRTVIAYWEGWKAWLYVYRGLATTETAAKINELRQERNVGLSRVLVDEDGVGGGVKDILRCKGFQGGASPLRGDRYANLKAQCGYALAKRINERKVAIDSDDVSIKEQVVAELDTMLRAKGWDKDGKLALVPKDDVKARIGRSPDLGDALMMRAWFDLVPKPGIVVITT